MSFIDTRKREYIFLANPFPRIKYLLRHDWDKKPELQIVTIAFNNLETIKLQAEYIRRYLTDNYQYIVCDNSTKNGISSQIKKYCMESNISYVRLKNNPHNGREASRSHAISVNWAYRHLIKSSRSKYFGIIDHDIFPTKKTSIINQINSAGMYGHIQIRGKKWYLWPGFCFFDKEILKKAKFDFSPVPGLDTGGANWLSIYKYKKPKDLNVPRHYYLKYRDGDVIQNTSMEKIGDWLHLMNASGWKDGTEKSDISKLIKKVIAKDKI